MNRLDRDKMWLWPDFRVAGGRWGTLARLDGWSPRPLTEGEIRSAVAEAELQLSEEASWYRYVALCMAVWVGWSFIIDGFFLAFIPLAVPAAKIVGAQPVLFVLRHPILVVFSAVFLPLVVWVLLDMPKYCRRCAVAPRRLLQLRLAIDQLGVHAVQELRRVLDEGAFPLVKEAVRRRNALSKAIQRTEEPHVQRIAG